MKDIQLKMRYIYWPFLLIMASVLVLYTFLNWLFVIRFELLEPKEFLVDYALPLLVVWAACYIWLRPRIKLLDMMKGRGDDRFYFIYQIVAIVLISLPLVLTQSYLKKTTGKVLYLTSISEIKKNNPAKYYHVDTLYMDKNKAGIATSFEVIGRGFNKKMEMKIYLTVPIYNYAADALYSSLTTSAWYGIIFTKKIPDSWSYESKEDAFKKFLQDTETDLSRLDLSDFSYLEREGNTSNIDYFEKAVFSSEAYKQESADPIVLTPRKGQPKEGLKELLIWISSSLLLGICVFFIMIAIPKVNESFLIHIKNKERNLVKESVRTFFEPLLPSAGFKIIPILIFINTLLFLLMAILHESFMTFDVDTLITWGGSSRSLVIDEGEWSRLVTNTFIHSGFIHFIMNMVALYFVGLLIEPILGSKNTLLVYILTGIVASVVSLLFNQHSVSVGASGAIMGMCGLFGVFLLTKVFRKDVARFMGIYFVVFIIYNLLIGLSGDIDNAAHIGGFVSGFILGFIFRYILRRSRRKKTQTKTTSSLE